MASGGFLPSGGLAACLRRARAACLASTSACGTAVGLCNLLVLEFPIFIIMPATDPTAMHYARVRCEAKTSENGVISIFFLKRSDLRALIWPVSAAVIIKRQF